MMDNGFSTSWHSYPSIYNLGHKAIADLLKRDVVVEEKIDGSQFSFGFHPALAEGGEHELRVRSKGAVMHPEAPEKMFTKAVETVKDLHARQALRPGWTYRGEYLQKPKHNSLAYDRTPKGHIIIFDINDGHESYLPHEEKRLVAEALGLECVPLLFQGQLEHIEDFRRFLETTSILGGQKIEGVVVKPAGYDFFGLDKKVLMGKFVSEAFKEIHSQAWKESNPTGKDILSLLGDRYNTPARWAKAVQHLREAGKLEDSPRDIGLIIKEVPLDIQKEETEAIKEYLFKWAWPHIARLTTRGLPQWYKESLLAKQFEPSVD